ncbi:MarR family winged helix-turn-helix transcriptional regulator [Limimaricola pyoseonensis]|uniref:DNA-binding transcriptional regulator, MarR family n=1 Tax=Limimaricola pyoseonensis TaxID=521013 RepID=A0A1G7J6E6_9RHOB|nr:MarR family winged helix-turn-helix transcriptional regulator [Limimaricola pyoseonensis]SDF20466.1 DNA-binding transcriptional regulator, MarR family [Limimaricola pyoseonensis]
MTPDDATIAAWVALATTSRELLERAERALKSEGHPPLAWYDALLAVEKAGPGGIRPVALKDRLLLPQYGTSRLLDRMVRAGLLERRPCPGDARGQVIVPTAAGRAQRAAMWPAYARFLAAEIGERLDPGEAAELARLLDKLRGAAG